MSFLGSHHERDPTMRELEKIAQLRQNVRDAEELAKYKSELADEWENRFFRQEKSLNFIRSTIYKEMLHLREQLHIAKGKEPIEVITSFNFIAQLVQPEGGEIQDIAELDPLSTLNDDYGRTDGTHDSVYNKIRKEAQAEKAQLENQFHKQILFKDNEIEDQRKQIEALEKRTREMSGEMDRSKIEFSEKLESERIKFEERLKEMEAQFAENRTKAENRFENIKSDYENQISALKDKLQKSNERMASEIRLREGRIEQLMQELAKAQNSSFRKEDDAEQLVTSLRVELFNKSEEFKKLENHIQREKARILKLERELKTDLENGQEREKELSERVEKMKSEMENFEEMRLELEAKCTELESLMQTAQDEFQKEIEQMRANHSSDTSEVERKHEEAMTALNASLELQRSELQQTITNQQEKLISLTNQITDLESDLTSQKTNNSFLETQISQLKVDLKNVETICAKQEETLVQHQRNEQKNSAPVPTPAPLPVSVPVPAERAIPTTHSNTNNAKSDVPKPVSNPRSIASTADDLTTLPDTTNVTVNSVSSNSNATKKKENSSQKAKGASGSPVTTGGGPENGLSNNGGGSGSGSAISGGVSASVSAVAGTNVASGGGGNTIFGGVGSLSGTIGGTHVASATGGGGNTIATGGVSGTLSGTNVASATGGGGGGSPSVERKIKVVSEEITVVGEQEESPTTVTATITTTPRLADIDNLIESLSPTFEVDLSKLSGNVEAMREVAQKEKQKWSMLEKKVKTMRVFDRLVARGLISSKKQESISTAEKFARKAELEKSLGILETSENNNSFSPSLANANTILSVPPPPPAPIGSTPAATKLIGSNRPRSISPSPSISSDLSKSGNIVPTRAAASLVANRPIAPSKSLSQAKKAIAERLTSTPTPGGGGDRDRNRDRPDREFSPISVAPTREKEKSQSPRSSNSSPSPSPSPSPFLTESIAIQDSHHHSASSYHHPTSPSPLSFEPFLPSLVLAPSYSPREGLLHTPIFSESEEEATGSPKPLSDPFSITGLGSSKHSSSPFQQGSTTREEDRPSTATSIGPSMSILSAARYQLVAKKPTPGSASQDPNVNYGDGDTVFLNRRTNRSSSFTDSMKGTCLIAPQQQNGFPKRIPPKDDSLGFRDDSPSQAAVSEPVVVPLQPRKSAKGGSPTDDLLSRSPSSLPEGDLVLSLVKGGKSRSFRTRQSSASPSPSCSSPANIQSTLSVRELKGGRTSPAPGAFSMACRPPTNAFDVSPSPSPSKSGTLSKGLTLSHSVPGGGVERNPVGGLPIPLGVNPRATKDESATLTPFQRRMAEKASQLLDRVS